MRILIALFIVSALAFASPADTKKKKTATPAKAAPVAQPLVIPKEAVANPDGSYAYTDKQGKKWIYNKTPFGVSRMQDMGTAAAAATEPKGQFVKAIDAGDTVKFERQSPFGVTKWEKKKSDLTDEERALLPAPAASAPQPE